MNYIHTLTLSKETSPLEQKHLVLIIDSITHKELTKALTPTESLENPYTLEKTLYTHLENPHFLIDPKDSPLRITTFFELESFTEEAKEEITNSHTTSAPLNPYTHKTTETDIIHTLALKKMITEANGYPENPTIVILTAHAFLSNNQQHTPPQKKQKITHSKPSKDFLSPDDFNTLQNEKKKILHDYRTDIEKSHTFCPPVVHRLSTQHITLQNQIKVHNNEIKQWLNVIHDTENPIQKAASEAYLNSHIHQLAHLYTLRKLTQNPNMSEKKLLEIEKTHVQRITKKTTIELKEKTYTLKKLSINACNEHPSLNTTPHHHE